MRLRDGGLDIFYVDESMDKQLFAMSAFPIPFLRKDGKQWNLVWEDSLKAVIDWRRRMKAKHGILMRKELKGQRLASGHGNYKNGKSSFTLPQSATVYRDILSDMDFLPESGVISCIGDRSSFLMGERWLTALLHALLQRMRTACEKNDRNGMIFFDEGHGEYRKIYRMGCGSSDSEARRWIERMVVSSSASTAL